MEQKKLTKIIVLSAIAVLLVLVALVFVLRWPSWQLGFAQPRDGLFWATPEPAPTAAPVVEPPVILAPPVSAFAPPEGAVDIIVARRILFAVENTEAAESLFADYLDAAGHQDLAENERLLKATLEQEVSLAPAGGKHPLLTHGEALDYLLGNPTLAPISREVARCEKTFSRIPEEMTSSRTLPEGSRLIAAMGTSEKWLIYSETSFKSGVECSVVETNRFQVGQESKRTVLLGTYTNKVNGAIARDEGVSGRRAEKLRFAKPIYSGSLSSYFGWHGPVWHNGIAYKSPAGTRLLAPEDGVVIFCGERGDYGFVIDIQHNDTGFVSRFAHCADVRVELWERVKKGAFIAALKSAEPPEDTRLHFELIVDGLPVNPLQYL
ncbi:MAG: M23 family metallopeptidase [Clostridiales bacterium]|nr:M23 family metallopeptidase [Clostridiales bacterium]